MSKSIEKEIAHTLANAVMESARIEDWAAALSALLNRVRAEALREASWKYILECRTPADVRDMIRAEADRIEQSSEGES